MPNRTIEQRRNVFSTAGRGAPNNRNSLAPKCPRKESSSKTGYTLHDAYVLACTPTQFVIVYIRLEVLDVVGGDLENGFDGGGRCVIGEVDLHDILRHGLDHSTGNGHRLAVLV